MSGQRRFSWFPYRSPPPRLKSPSDADPEQPYLYSMARTETPLTRSAVDHLVEPLDVGLHDFQQHLRFGRAVRLARRHPGHQVFVIASAPILVIRVTELPAVTRRAATVAAQRRVAARVKDGGRIKSWPGGEVLREDTGRAAVNDQQQRDALSGLVIDRIFKMPSISIPSPLFQRTISILPSGGFGRSALAALTFAGAKLSARVT